MDVPSANWYMGLFDVNGNPKPDYTRCRTLTSSLRGETLKQRLSNSHSDVWLLEFTGSGQDTLVAWDTGPGGRTVTVSGWGTY